MIWVNGNKQNAVAASDRAIQFGDGCFTTARIRAGHIEQFAAHIQRLQQACERLWIAGVDWDRLREEMRQAAEDHGEGVLKAVISRGSGGRGYDATECTLPTRILYLSSYPERYHRLRDLGARLVLSPVRLGKNPHLAGVKHLNRLEQVLIRTQLEQTGADEALVLDSDAMLVECCAANFFWRVGTQVYTPDLASSGVNGIQRQRVMQQVVDLGFTLHVVRAGVEALALAEEAVITNALMPVLPVHQIEAWQYDSRHLFRLLNPH